MISDASIIGFRHDIFKILYQDPMAKTMTKEIGSITAAGVSGQPCAPGGPSWRLLEETGRLRGGTGAYLGVIGQMGGQGGAASSGGIRAASVTGRSQPTRSKCKEGIRFLHLRLTSPDRWFWHVISTMMPPQIIDVVHASIR